MPIVAKNQAVIPPGKHEGLITEARETKRDFGNLGGPEDTVEITIAPKWQAKDGAETMPVVVNYSPVLNGLSGLSRLCAALGVQVEEGKPFDVVNLAGREIVFEADLNAKKFVRVKKETIRAK